MLKHYIYIGYSALLGGAVRHLRKHAGLTCFGDLIRVGNEFGSHELGGTAWLRGLPEEHRKTVVY